MMLQSNGIIHVNSIINSIMLENCCNPIVLLHSTSTVNFKEGLAAGSNEDQISFIGQCVVLLGCVIAVHVLC